MLRIYPEEEYFKRLKAAEEAVAILGVRMEMGPYESEKWGRETVLLKGEPEGGRRCEVCFRMRLLKTHEFMLERGMEAFTTTLTVSPHKSAEVVNRVGSDVGGQAFLARDFKKMDGFKRAVQLAKEGGIYRQRYCGCVYSMR